MNWPIYIPVLPFNCPQKRSENGNYSENPPIDIDGDTLTFDKESNVFKCGCKRIPLELADEIFHYIGKNLGYTIT